MEKLWTTEESARWLGISEADVEQLVRQGQLTAYKLGGQFLRFRPGQVQLLKGRVQLGSRPASRRGQGWWQQARDFVYFYDFYLVSATCLAMLVVYLIAS